MAAKRGGGRLWWRSLAEDGTYIKVKEKIEHAANPIYELHVDEAPHFIDDDLRCTSLHRVRVPSEGANTEVYQTKKAKDLNSGDIVMCSDGFDRTLGRVTKEPEITKVFGFTFEPDKPPEVHMPMKVAISSMGEEAGVKQESIHRSRSTAGRALSDAGTADDWPPI